MGSSLHKQTFGRLTVIELAGVNGHRHSLWLCVCRCGNQVEVTQPNLLSGATRSCGCIRIEVARARAIRGELDGKPKAAQGKAHGATTEATSVPVVRRAGTHVRVDEPEHSAVRVSNGRARDHG